MGIRTLDELVDTLPQENLNVVRPGHEIAVPALRVPPLESPRARAVYERARDRLLASIQILSRVSVRLSSERVEQLVTLSIKLYHSPLARATL